MYEMMGFVRLFEETLQSCSANGGKEAERWATTTICDASSNEYIINWRQLSKGVPILGSNDGENLSDIPFPFFFRLPAPLLLHLLFLVATSVKSPARTAGHVQCDSA
jgi:hypothetical protein